MSNLAVDSFFPQWNIWTQFLEDTTAGLKLDSLEESHPIEVTSFEIYYELSIWWSIFVIDMVGVGTAGRTHWWPRAVQVGPGLPWILAHQFLSSLFLGAQKEELAQQQALFDSLLNWASPSTGHQHRCAMPCLAVVIINCSPVCVQSIAMTSISFQIINWKCRFTESRINFSHWSLHSTLAYVFQLFYTLYCIVTDFITMLPHCLPYSILKF